MTLPPRLQREIDGLKELSWNIEISEDSDYINLVLINFSLEEGYSEPVSDLLLRVPRCYPDAGPDMFWVDPKILLDTGQIPQSAENIEIHLEKKWRRFSWHRQGSSWNPIIDNIHSYVEFIHRRLREKK